MSFLHKIVNTIIERGLQLKDFFLKKTDPALVLFLLLLLNYRISFKIIAIIGIYLYRPKIQFKKDGLSLFYLSMIILSTFHLTVINRDFSVPHVLAVLTGVLLWVGCLLAYLQIKFAIENNENYKIVNTLKTLTILNLMVTCYDYLKIVFITKTINPFTQISPPPYGISSGDLMGGVFGEMHLVNTVISCFFVVFFLYKNKTGYAILALLPFLLTGSNLGTLILAAMLVYILLVERNVMYKTMAIVLLSLITIFYTKVTPDNKNYMVKVLSKVGRQITGKAEPETGNKPDSLTLRSNNFTASVIKRQQTKEELISLYIAYLVKTNKIAKSKSLPKENDSLLEKINVHNLVEAVQSQKVSDYVFARKDSLTKAKARNPFFEFGKLKKYNLEKESGKLTSFKQTRDYLKHDVVTTLFGGGVGSFSSRLAFVNSRIVDDSRILMALPYYETKEFKQNHKSIFKYLMYRDDETHSITNLPFCWYNQIFGEYGVIGFLCFIFLYCTFFIKRITSLKYGRLLLVCLFGFLFFDYWYERLSVMVIFEFLMLLDIKENNQKEVTEWESQ